MYTLRTEYRRVLGVRTSAHSLIGRPMHTKGKFLYVSATKHYVLVLNI